MDRPARPDPHPAVALGAVFDGDLGQGPVRRPRHPHDHPWLRAGRRRDRGGAWRDSMGGPAHHLARRWRTRGGRPDRARRRRAPATLRDLRRRGGLRRPDVPDFDPGRGCKAELRLVLAAATVQAARLGEPGGGDARPKADFVQTVVTSGFRRQRIETCVLHPSGQGEPAARRHLPAGRQSARRPHHGRHPHRRGRAHRTADQGRRRAPGSRRFPGADCSGRRAPTERTPAWATTR